MLIIIFRSNLYLDFYFRNFDDENMTIHKHVQSTNSILHY